MSEPDHTQIPGFRGAAAATEPDEAELRRGALGLRSVVFQNMTNMAPAAAIVYDFPTQIAAAGAALWPSPRKLSPASNSTENEIEKAT